MSFSTLQKVGIISLSVIIFRIGQSLVKQLYGNVIGPAMEKNANLKLMGRWAVVTGATDATGKAYAQALAKRGIDLILIAREKAKLQSIAAELESEYRICTKIIQADFPGDTPETYDDIEDQLHGMEIGILINNAAICNPQPDYYLDLPGTIRIYSRIIKCNINSVINMCLMILPQMVERRKGVIVNISSTTAMIPSPMLTVYGASMAFIEKFSKDLDFEYDKSGVIIQCVLPGYIANRLRMNIPPTYMTPPPEVFVERSLRSIGILKHTTGYFPHTVMVGVINMIDTIAPSYITSVITQAMEKMRRRAILRYVG